MPFVHGCNYPWSTDGDTVFYGLDFGANVWGTHLGVSTRRAAVRQDFLEMASLGFVVTRWFVFADGRAGIQYGDDGLPVSLDPYFFGDLDAALEIAAEAGVQLHLVLLDHRWMFEGLADRLADPATGSLLDVRLPAGRARVLLTAAGREALFERVIAPLVRRYGHGGGREQLGRQIFGLELMNEPDFVVEEWEADVSPSVPRPLRFEMLAQMVAALSALVHDHLAAITTVGCARAHNLWAWDDDGLGLDLLQVHSYPDSRYPGRDVDPVSDPASSLRVSRPVLVGEFPANPAERRPAGTEPLVRSAEEVLDAALSGGYAGAWPWSFSGTDAFGPLPAPPLRSFAARRPDVVNPRARGIP